jgi:threonine/homoserine/homoserine lactone efflux protein
MVILLSVGMEKLLTMPGIPAVIAFLGGIFLIYMSYGIIKHPDQGSPFPRNEHKDSLNQPLTKQPIISGALVTLGNPFWFVWWLTIGVTMLTRSSIIGTLGSIAFYLGHIFADYSWLSFISFVISSGRRFLNNKVYSSIMISCAIFLGIIGLYFVVSGSSQLITTWRA